MSIILSDIVLEIAAALIVAAIVAYLWWIGGKEGLRRQAGWTFIASGFALILIATAIDVTDNFDSLSRYGIVGDTQYQAFLERVIGFLVGFMLLAIGFGKWLPEIAARRSTEAALRNDQR